MSNTSGAYPIDPTTQVGLFRFELGDVVATNIDETLHTADYEAISDATISALLTANPTAPGRAMSSALDSWATQLISAAQDIQVDDIRIKTVEKASLMSARASGLAAAFGLADSASAFQVVPMRVGTSPTFPYVQGQPAAFGESGF